MSCLERCPYFRGVGSTIIIYSSVVTVPYFNPGHKLVFLPTLVCIQVKSSVCKIAGMVPYILFHFSYYEV